MGKRLPAVWLVVIDIVLVAAGVGVFYLYLAVVPQAYEVVVEPTRPVHPTVVRVAVLQGAPTVRAANTSARNPTPTHTATPTSSATATAATPAASRQPALSVTTTKPATATPDLAAVPRPTVTRLHTATPPSPAPTSSLPAPPLLSGAELGGGKFADKFTSGEVEQTATSYRSANISVTLSHVQRSGVTFYVQDIYVRYIDNLRTAFARNTYGRAIADWTPNLATANNAIGAINGDYYGGGKLGAVIRNGKLYNAQPDGEVGVLFGDGTMRVYGPREFDAEQVMAAGAWQAWDFGPGLMTPEGKAIGVFDSGIAGLHPRTAIGYVEPGHYLFVVVDGRQAGYSRGMTLAQLAALFEELGARAAYNLDGGQTSVMTFGGQVVNRPYRGGRPTSDIIFVGE